MAVRKLSLVIALFVPISAQAQAGPAALRPAIELRHPDVRWVTVDELRGWRDVVLLDARAPAEYRVSHLEGASRIDPVRADVSLLAARHDARVVVYCSVGWRSAAVAERLRAAGYRRVFNLEGGIFEWANRGFPVVRGSRRVRAVHPYDGTWGLLLDRALHAYRP